MNAAYGAHFTDEEPEADTSFQCPLGISHSQSVLDPEVAETGTLGSTAGWLKELALYCTLVLQKESIK